MRVRDPALLLTRCASGVPPLFFPWCSMSRIGVRLIISHHLNIGDADQESHGIINRKCTPADLAAAAISATRGLAYQHYGEAPDVDICGNTDLTFPYVDRHMFLCLFELLKNSLRATIETHRDADTLPPVKLIIADGVEDVTVSCTCLQNHYSTC